MWFVYKAINKHFILQSNKKKRNMLSAYDLSGMRKSLTDLNGEEVGSFVKWVVTNK